MATWPYNTQKWQRLRKAKLAMDPLCQQCQQDGRVTAAQHVDHVKPINQGGDAWNIEGLRSLCASCHSRKTRHVDQLGKAAVPRRIIKGCDATGWPLDPEHHWNKKTCQS